MNKEYRDKDIIISDRIQEISADIVKIQHNINLFNINFEEQNRKINKLNSDFFHLYNKMRALTFYSIASSIIILALVVVTFYIK